MATKKKASTKKKAAKKAKSTKRPKRKAESAPTPATSTLSLGDIADELQSLRTDRLAVQADVTQMKSEQNELEAVAIRELAKAKLQKASGMTATISSNVSTIAVVEDWDEFTKWIHRRKDLSVLGRKLNQAHIKDLQAEGKAPKGLRFESINKLSITKLG